MHPHLVRIDLYPIKSLDGVTVQTATVLPSGALQDDRTFALFDQAGKFVNGKRNASVHGVRSHFSADVSAVTVQAEAADASQTFRLVQEKAALEAWFSAYFQQPITLQQNTEMGFPDDTDSPGPTVISTATLQAVADWFGLSLAEVRRRFRTNLEIDGVPAFWEDRLFSETGDPVTFQIGAVPLQGINPCQRCVVPTRDPQTGAAMPAFQKQFIQQRAATLPAGVARSRFNHFYRLAVNTRVLPVAAGKSLKVGDVVSCE
ncbi:MAG: MOSC N-terminal beta barrel domain-containing protein [Leptolyngbya sp. SIO1E4]|nr:MOSC N-terminal beta barrel domain-containing protein [Leptolyngbya sp. SIO1E4]